MFFFPNSLYIVLMVWSVKLLNILLMENGGWDVAGVSYHGEVARQKYSISTVNRFKQI